MEHAEDPEPSSNRDEQLTRKHEKVGARTTTLKLPPELPPPGRTVLTDRSCSVIRHSHRDDEVVCHGNTFGSLQTTRLTRLNKLISYLETQWLTA